MRMRQPDEHRRRRDGFSGLSSSSRSRSARLDSPDSDQRTRSSRKPRDPTVSPPSEESGSVEWAAKRFRGIQIASTRSRLGIGSASQHRTESTARSAREAIPTFAGPVASSIHPSLRVPSVCWAIFSGCEKANGVSTDASTHSRGIWRWIVMVRSATHRATAPRIVARGAALRWCLSRLGRPWPIVIELAISCDWK